MKKRISIRDLQPGMFVSRLDVSWFKTPFLRHSWKIKNEEEIHQLRNHGIQELVIDTSKGVNTSETISQAHQSTVPKTTPTEESGQGNFQTTGRPDFHELEIVRSLRTDSIHALDKFFEDIPSNAVTHLSQMRNIVDSLLDGLLTHQVAMISLTQMKRFSTHLSTHVVDTCVLAIAMGVQHEVNIEQLKMLGLAALLHDVGHLRLPLNTLRKRDPFTEHEHQLMRMHPEMSYAIISEATNIPDHTKTAVLQHHERINGTGYPHGLKGREVSLLSQLLSIADTYDAQISGRCNAPPIPPAQALRTLYQAADHGEYDSVLIQRLIQLLGVYPIGSLVELNTGERAVVIWIHSHNRLRPCVKILTDAQRQIYDDPEIVDLSTRDDETNLPMITRSLDPREEGIDISPLLESL